MEAMSYLPVRKLAQLRIELSNTDAICSIGSEILVGRTQRSNDGGAELLRTSFPNYPVFVVDVPKLASAAGRTSDLETPLHLKSFCSMYGVNKMLVGGEIGFQFSQWLQDRTDRYEFIHLPDEAAANCISCNGAVIRRSGKEFPHSDAILRRQLPPDMRQIEIECSELGKVDGALTCCAVLF